MWLYCGGLPQSQLPPAEKCCWRCSSAEPGAISGGGLRKNPSAGADRKLRPAATVAAGFAGLVLMYVLFRRLSSILLKKDELGVVLRRTYGRVDRVQLYARVRLVHPVRGRV